MDVQGQVRKQLTQFSRQPAAVGALCVSSAAFLWQCTICYSGIQTVVHVMLWLLSSNAAVGVYTDVVCTLQELDTARATVQARAEVVIANNEDSTVHTLSLLTRLVTV